MSRNRTIYLIGTPDGRTLLAEWRWTVSRGRDTYGYNICSLWIDGRKVASCDGGGYDLMGTCLGEWLEATFAERLCEQIKQNMYALEFHHADHKPDENGARYSQIPTAHHTLATINGACGMQTVMAIGEAIGLTFEPKAA